jgi:hypothetical protein
VRSSRGIDGFLFVLVVGIVWGIFAHNGVVIGMNLYRNANRRCLIGSN